VRAAAVIINHNGGDDVLRCVEALRAQTVPVEIVLVDCLSTDGSRQLALAPPPGVRGLPLAENLGYAGGGNAGVATLASEVEAIGFFNPDCFPAPDFFAICVELLERDSMIGGVAARLERPEGILDSCGQVPTASLLMVRDRGYEQSPSVELEQPARVLAACGAGMVYRRSALLAAGCWPAFPAEMFAFWEDFDLGWRASNAGFRIVFEPRAKAIHRRGATAASGAGRLIFRRPPEVAAGIVLNRWVALVHNLHWFDFLLRVPVLLPMDMLMTLLVIARRPAVLTALWSGRDRLRAATRRRRTLRQRRLRELL
jgi:N-acetylglucosaminyl-diphospho-decaprenol L-rhamnosyltransferase